MRLPGHSTLDPERSWWCLHLRVRLVCPSELLNEQRRLGWSISQIAPISHHASAYSGEPLATGFRRHLTSCYGRTHPALHHVAIHITRPNPGMAPGPGGFFTSSRHLTQMLTGHHALGVVCLDVPGQPSHALANCNACHPTISQVTQRAPCRLI